MQNIVITTLDEEFRINNKISIRILEFKLYCMVFGTNAVELFSVDVNPKMSI